MADLIPAFPFDATLEVVPANGRLDAGTGIGAGPLGLQVPVAAERPSPVVGTAAGFHRDPTGRQVDHEYESSAWPGRSQLPYTIRPLLCSFMDPLRDLG